MGCPVLAVSWGDLAALPPSPPPPQRRAGRDAVTRARHWAVPGAAKSLLRCKFNPPGLRLPSEAPKQAPDKEPNAKAL